MILRKMCLGVLFFIMLPSEAYCNIGVYFPIEVPISKKTLLIGAAVGGSIVAAYYIYNYFCVMTLPKAERLCNDVSAFIEEVTSKYHQELAAIDKGINDELLKVELQNIITSQDSESPYLTYTNNVRSITKKDESFEESFSYGIPQLQGAMDKVVKKLNAAHECCLERDELESLVQKYKKLFHSIAGLRELLHAIRFKMQRLIRLCMQFDAYRQEKILERLQAIETQMVFDRMQPKTINNIYYA